MGKPCPVSWCGRKEDGRRKQMDGEDRDGGAWSRRKASMGRDRVREQVGAVVEQGAVTIHRVTRRKRNKDLVSRCPKRYGPKSGRGSGPLGGRRKVN
jgi:hypothetical protein